MRRFIGPWVGLALALGLGPALPPRASAAEAAPAYRYEALGKLAVMRDGRIKPLDTLARLEVRRIYGRNDIKLTDPEGHPLGTWGPVAAFFDWMARPEFWDDQDFIKVEYLPLKEKLLAGSMKQRHEQLVKAARARLKAAGATADAAITPETLDEAARRPGLAEADREALKALANKLGEDRKHFSPRELQDARVEVDGRSLSFLDWIVDIAPRHRAAQAPMGRAPKVSPIEEKALEVAERLTAYQAIRGDREVRVEPFDLMVPRPHDAAYLKFTADAIQKLMEESGAMRGAHGSAATSAQAPTDLDRDAGHVLQKYMEELQVDDKRALFQFIGGVKPGESLASSGVPNVVRNFQTWLRETADWVPLKVVMAADDKELARAGYPAREIGAFRAAWKDLVAAEDATPGRVPEAKAAALVTDARALGESLGSYPEAARIGAEMRFNQVAPFYWAPWFYASAVLLLLICLGIEDNPGVAEGRSRRILIGSGSVVLMAAIAWAVWDLMTGFARGYAGARAVLWIPWIYGAVILPVLIGLVVGAWPRTTVGRLRRMLYGLGLAGLAAGIGWEVWGFGHRVYITKWAPVTNMYETVIWVALVAAGLGLVFELIYRKTYFALAAAGAALITTVLAYNVPLLDANIKNLPPVLRSNYWLTIHVLTIVSSYAAFLLAMMLGLIAVTYYLTATYRRRVDLIELASPLVLTPLLMALGLAGIYGSTRGYWPASVGPDQGYRIGSVVFGMGAFLAIVSVGGMAGELISRATFRDAHLVFAELPEPVSAPVSAPAFHGGGGGVATAVKPSVDEIRARAAATRPKLDARGLAMQATAAKIKPLSNFIYRAMQVGVLLVAAGTILGGVWADYSWGRFWGWDPKEVWALITLLVYLVPLHGRFAGWVNTFGLTVASVACFLSVLMAWYGVNFVLGVGLHSYGFTEGGGQGIVMAVTAGVLAYVGAAWWRRMLAQRPATSA